MKKYGVIVEYLFSALFLFSKKKKKKGQICFLIVFALKFGM